MNTDMNTEDEAKTKWCPMVRAVRGDVTGAFNRGIAMEPDVSCLCIGSACMMWRFSNGTAGGLLQKAKTYAREGERVRAVKELRAAYGFTLLEAKSIVDGEAMWPDPPDIEGYCGLAGKPE